MSSFEQQPYQSASYALQKDFGNETKYSFDSPNTIAERQLFQQAGGSGLSNTSNTTQYASFANLGQTNIPTPPPLPARPSQRSWKSGPYKQRGSLRTRDWGNQSNNQWNNWSTSTFNNQIQTIESSRSTWTRNAWLEEKGLGQQRGLGLEQQQFSQLPQQQFSQLPQQQFSQLPQQQFAQSSLQQQQFLPQSNFQQTQYTSSSTISGAPLQGTGLAAPALLSGRKGRRQRRKLAKQNAVANQLQARLPAPIGDPEINHYRRGAPATVPVIGAGLPTGRRSARRHNRGRRANRGPNFLPVVAPAGYQAPVQTHTVPYVAAPIGDPEVNHYRRGAPAIVPTIGGNGTLAGAVGRRSGRRLNRGRRAARTPNVLPVVAPVGTPLAPQVAPTFYRTSVHQPLSSSANLAQPISTQPLAAQPLSSSAGIPLSTSGITSGLNNLTLTQQPLYSSALPAQSINTGLSSQQPLYSSATQQQPISIFEKKEQTIIQPAARPIGSATF